MNFEMLSRKKQQILVITEIIKSLRKLGGKTTTKNIKQDLLNRENVIPESYITNIVVSQRSGNSYKPFDYVFNFSVRELEFSGYISHLEKGEIELTKLGRLLDMEQLNVQRDVLDKAQPKWKEKHQENLAKKSMLDEQDDMIVVDDEDTSEPSNWRDTLLTALLNLSPAKFELFSRSLVKEMGVDLDDSIGIKLSGDGGLDGFGYLTADDFRTARVAIQAKKWNNMVSSPEIDKFRGAMDKYNAEFGIFVTTSGFSREAINAARTGTRVITLINGEKLVELVAKYQLHVKPVRSYELDDFFKEKD